MTLAPRNLSPVVKVATLNLHDTPEFYLERVTEAAKEAASKNVDIIAVQEITYDQKDTVVDVFNQAGYTYQQVSGSVASQRTREKSSATGVFSKHPVLKSSELNLSARAETHKSAVLITEFHGYEIHVISTHFLWGAQNGHLRLKQANIMNDYALRHQQNQKQLIILAGTLNDVPDADSIRFLTGHKASTDSRESFWVDVTENTEHFQTPTTRENSWRESAARENGVLLPELVPAQKLDYILINGWVYGKSGMPQNTTLFGVNKLPTGEDLSDHYGLVTEIWVP